NRYIIYSQRNMVLNPKDGKICRPGLPDRAAIFVLYDLQMKNINIKYKIYLTYAMRKSRMTIKGGAE
ncbi:MAG: hypothetical protein ACI4ER_09700, partial [Suilimivivens sp.]